MSKLFVILFLFNFYLHINAQVNHADTIAKYLNYIVDTSQIKILEVKKLAEVDADNLYITCKLLQIKNLLNSITYCDDLIKTFKTSANEYLLLLESNKTSKILSSECKKHIDIWEYYLNQRREGIALVELLNTQELIVLPANIKTMETYTVVHFKIGTMPSQIVILDTNFSILTKYKKYSQYMDICIVKWMNGLDLSTNLRKFNF